MNYEYNQHAEQQDTVQESIEFYINYAQHTTTQSNGKATVGSSNKDLVEKNIQLEKENAFLKGQVLAFEKAMTLIEKLIR